MHYLAKCWTQLSASKIWHFRRGLLRQDPSNRLPALAHMNLAHFSRLSDPFASIVVEFTNADRLHVTHCVTLQQARQSVERLKKAYADAHPRGRDVARASRLRASGSSA